MTEPKSRKSDVQVLQKVIVEGLEDVKGQNIQVFNTEALSPLFERVIIASGTSNRQTRALASSVSDAVKEAGFVKPRIEGEDNGEWIIVDCGPVVCHVMQPNIRQYYHLEEIWGAKSVRLKSAATTATAAKKAPAKKAAKVKAAEEAAPVTTAPAKKAKATTTTAAKAPTVAKATKTTTRSGGKTASTAKTSPAVKAPAKKVAAKKTATKVKTVVVGQTAKKPAAKKAAKPAARKTAPKAPRSAE